MLDEEGEEMSLDDMLQKYISQEHLRFEGDSGMEDLEKLIKAIGHKGHGFRWGTPIESFLSDNPGAVEKLIEWIGEMDLKEWKEALEGEIAEEDEEEDGD